MGNVTNVFLMIPLGSLPGFVTQTFWKGFLQAKWAREILTKGFGKQHRRGKVLEGIINEDLGHVSQILLPKMMGNDPMLCGFVYVIAPILC